MDFRENDRLSTAQLERELKREQYRTRFRRTLRNTAFLLVVAAAAAVLLTVLLLPTYRITGDSMKDTLSDGDVVVAVRAGQLKPGDVVAFYYNNSILIKRVIAREGDWVSIEEDGGVWVNGALLEEPYVSEQALGACEIEFPYLVPEGRYFVLGDYRAASVDSRNAAIGCVSGEIVAGKLVLRVWPPDKLGFIG